MSEENVAFRYAKPLLELSIEKGTVDEVYQDMVLLKETCDQNRELLAILKNPVIRGYKKFSILKALFEKEFSPLTLSMIEIMARKNRESVLYALSTEFKRLYNEHKNIQEVTLISSVALSDPLKEELKKKLENGLKKTIHLQEKINPELIGGFVVQIGSSQIDNSLKNSLQRLKMNFIQRIYN